MNSMSILINVVTKSMSEVSVETCAIKVRELSVIPRVGEEQQVI